jgi:hypothetical protein
MRSTVSRFPIQKFEDSIYNFKNAALRWTMFLFLQKLQLGPIDAACQELQYALQNSARAILFSLFSFFPHVFLCCF